MSQKRMKTDKTLQAATQEGNQEVNQGGAAQDGMNQESKPTTNGAANVANTSTKPAPGDQSTTSGEETNQNQASSNTISSNPETTADQPKPAVQTMTEDSNPPAPVTVETKGIEDVQQTSTGAQKDENKSEQQDSDQKPPEMQVQPSETNQGSS
eukprot:749117-Hanusia_phi.AAC.5